MPETKDLEPEDCTCDGTVYPEWDWEKKKAIHWRMCPFSEESLAARAGKT